MLKIRHIHKIMQELWKNYMHLTEDGIMQRWV